MKFIDILNEDAYESNVLKTTGMKPIVDAIINRRPMSFMYRGPRSGKEKVLAGKRKNVQAVAIGLTKKNKMAIRAWVPSNNPSLTGMKSQWKTFLLCRMSGIQIDTNTNFEEPPGFKNTENKNTTPNNPFIKIYASTDFGVEPKKPRKARKPKPAKPMLVTIGWRVGAGT